MPAITRFSIATTPITPPPAATPAARNGHAATQLPSRRELFALAAVLAATVLTFGAAVAGLTRTPAPAQSSPPVVDQIIRPAPTAPPRVEPGD